MDQEPEQLRRAEACARTALSLDDHDAVSHEAMGYVCQHQRKFDLAGMHFNRAMSLNPNDVFIAVDRANWLVRVALLDGLRKAGIAVDCFVIRSSACQPAEALQSLEAAMQRDPSSPTWLWEVRYNTLFPLKRYDEAIAALRNISTWHYWHHAYIAAAYAHAGRSMRRVRRSPHF